MPSIENQEANDLAQIASGYRITEIKFKELIKIRDKLASKKSGSDELSTPKLRGARESNDEIFSSSFGEIFAIDNLSDNDW